MDLKHISHEAIPRALALGERYRLLNEPDQAASICRDILEVEPANQDALRMLLLSLTDQFGRKHGTSWREAEQAAEALASQYDQAYYKGVVYERWGRSKLQDGSPIYVAGEWLQRAMAEYETAEKLRPEADDAAILRWNSCARMLKRVPELTHASAAHEMHFGD